MQESKATSGAFRKTASEQYFEKFLIERSIDFDLVPTSDMKTPDYLISGNGQRIAVEVKEIERNKEEIESDRLLEERGYGLATGGAPGDRVRKKISQCAGQRIEKNVLPFLLVLYDQGRAFHHLSEYNILTAMHGLEQLHLSVPKDISKPISVVGVSNGPKKKMNEDCNTSISAIGVLAFRDKDKMTLDIYHNKFATVLLAPSMLAYNDIKHFQIDNSAARLNWKAIK
jgi:hypothetical protein